MKVSSDYNTFPRKGLRTFIFLMFLVMISECNSQKSKKELGRRRTKLLKTHHLVESDETYKWLTSYERLCISVFKLAASIFFVFFALYYFKQFNCFCYFTAGLALIDLVAIWTNNFVAYNSFLWQLIGIGIGVLIALPAYCSIYYSFQCLGVLLILPILKLLQYVQTVLVEPEFIFFGNFIGKYPDSVYYLQGFYLAGIIMWCVTVGRFRFLRRHFLNLIIANFVATSVIDIFSWQIVHSNYQFNFMKQLLAILWIYFFVVSIMICHSKMKLEINHKNQYCIDKRFMPVNDEGNLELSPTEYDKSTILKE